MRRIAVVGAGICGLTVALLLARDGHTVTVLERDAAGPPEPGAAWDGWERRGVAQFRQAHAVLPLWYRRIATELPDLPGRLAAGGARPFNLAAELTGGGRAGDERFTTVAIRRPVLEAVLAELAAAEPGVTVRRGARVRGLVPGASVRPGVPHVAGVELSGETVAADVVVDAAGRRSPGLRWLAATGARPPEQERADSGFVTYSRFYRGRVPDMLAPQTQTYDSLSVLTLPADDSTWSVSFTGAAADAALRPMREAGTFEAVARSYPMVAHWIDGEPVTGVRVMAGLDDRIRHDVVDGEPVATGVLAVGDAWASTNPTAGRGMTMALLHAVLLRDVLRVEHGSPADLAWAWDDATRREMEPRYRDTLAGDRHRLAQIRADRRGEIYTPDDERVSLTRAFFAAAAADPDVLRALLDVYLLLEPVASVLSRPGLVQRVQAAGEAPAYLLPGPDREGLLAALAA